MKMIYCVLTLAAVSTGTTCHAGTVTLFDGTFANGDWSTSNSGSNVGGTSGTQVPLGGTPGAFRQVTNSGFNISAVVTGRNFGWHFNTAQAYDPADGAIESVTYSENSLPIASYSQTGHFALRQDGLLFRSVGSFPITGSTTAWATNGLPNLAAQDFQAFFNGTFLPTANPDFSESGSPIEFGFFRSNSVPPRGQGLSQTGIDNWRVVLTTATDPVPEPTTLFIALLGLGLVLGRRTLGIARPTTWQPTVKPRSLFA